MFSILISTIFTASHWVTSTSHEDVIGAKLNLEHWFFEVGYKLRILPVLKAKSEDGTRSDSEFKVRENFIHMFYSIISK